ncbi:unnamed protein product, partial [Polarella glacialis]
LGWVAEKPILLGAVSTLALLFLFPRKESWSPEAQLRPRTDQVSVAAEMMVKEATVAVSRAPVQAPARLQTEPPAPAPHAVVQAPPSPSAPKTQEAIEMEVQIMTVVQARAGIYRDKTAYPEFASVVLVTAANGAYLDFYRNWECHAMKHGLDWAVIANDDATKNLDPGRSIPVLPNVRVSGMHGWGSVQLDVVGWNKIDVVMRIMKLTGLDVVFSDGDNMFKGDPFAKGVSLGDLIRSNKYDYVYQEELAKAPEKGHEVPGDGGNTGFFYVSPKRKPEKIIQFFSQVLKEGGRIRDENFKTKGQRLGADQPIFWEVVQALRANKQAANGPWGFRCAHLCSQDPTCVAPADETLDYCAMDAFTHPTGWEKPPTSFATYHANYAVNNDKIAKLEKAGVWGEWNVKTGRCKSGASVISAAAADDIVQVAKPQSAMEVEIIRVVQKRVGLYLDKASNKEFARVVLVTAANGALQMHISDSPERQTLLLSGLYHLKPYLAVVQMML